MNGFVSLIKLAVSEDGSILKPEWFKNLQIFFESINNQKKFLPQKNQLFES